jgi:hypothetical protein
VFLSKILRTSSRKISYIWFLQKEYLEFVIIKCGKTNRNDFMREEVCFYSQIPGYKRHGTPDRATWGSPGPVRRQMD